LDAGKPFYKAKRQYQNNVFTEDALYCVVGDSYAAGEVSGTRADLGRSRFARRQMQ